MHQVLPHANQPAFVFPNLKPTGEVLDPDCQGPEQPTGREDRSSCSSQSCSCSGRLLQDR